MTQQARVRLIAPGGARHYVDVKLTEKQRTDLDAFCKAHVGLRFEVDLLLKVPETDLVVQRALPR